ncbi:MAG: hypothetical protein FWG80_01095 [Alphaproteobacteria bacterium]|nr:hypothetical protein [Alphaproteobacteria bacterium]
MAKSTGSGWSGNGSEAVCVCKGCVVVVVAGCPVLIGDMLIALLDAAADTPVLLARDAARHEPDTNNPMIIKDKIRTIHYNRKQEWKKWVFLNCYHACLTQA